MEKDMLNIYYLNNNDLFSMLVKEKFSLDLQINHRNIFIYSRTRLVENPYVEKTLKEKVSMLNSVYLEGREYNKSKEKLDLDFDIGINNFNVSFDNILLKSMLKKYKKLYILVRFQHNNKNRRILNEFNILFYREGYLDEYLIEISNQNNNYEYINRYLYGIFIDLKECVDVGKGMSFNEKDLMNIVSLLNNFSLVFVKVPIYANYNWMLYTKNTDICAELMDNIVKMCDKYDIICSKMNGLR